MSAYNVMMGITIDKSFVRLCLLSAVKPEGICVSLPLSVKLVSKDIYE